MGKPRWLFNTVCLILLLFCGLIETKICKTEQRFTLKNNTSVVKVIESCCPGYRESESGCEECEDGFYGNHCTSECNCYSDHSVSTVCNKEDGQCDCKSGWRGRECFQPCKDFTYGKGCQRKCNCIRHFTKYCHHVTGRCICEAYMKGERCSHSAVGRQVRQATTSKAPPTTCFPGFTSPGCTKCPAFYYADCSTKCKCIQANSKSCDNVRGLCTCKDGYIGEICDTKCKDFFYGAGCKTACACSSKYAASCDHETGKCLCLPGYDPDIVVNGQQCTKSCSNYTYGQNCSLNCNCIREYAESCNTRYGYCFCKPGRIGETCNQTCSGFSYGYSCDSRCRCVQINSQSCDAATGACNCKAGYTGETCNENCTSWTFGPNCNENCSCVVDNTETCDRFSGTCSCKPGWEGSACSSVCSGYKYGVNCNQSCNCSANQYPTCHHLTAKCTCKPGFYGTSCENECVEGTFGALCLGTCKCTTASTVRCDKATGACVCKDGYTGITCSEVIVDVAPQNPFLNMTELHFALVVVGTILLFAIIVFIFWRCLSCTCKEFKERLCKKGDTTKDHEMFNNDKGASTLEMNTLATNGGTLPAVSQKDGRSPSFAAPEYYYSSDLQVIGGKNPLPPKEKAEPSQDYYYSDSLPVPGTNPAPAAAGMVSGSNSAEPGAAYYTDGFTPKLPGVDSIPRGKPTATNQPVGQSGEYYSDAFTPTQKPAVASGDTYYSAGDVTPSLPGVDTIPKGKQQAPGTPKLPDVHTIPRAKVEAVTAITAELKNKKQNKNQGPAYYTDAFTPKLPGVDTIPGNNKKVADTPPPPAVNSIPGYAKVEKPPTQTYQNTAASGSASHRGYPPAPVPAQPEYGNVDNKPKPMLQDTGNVYESLDIDPNRQTIYTELP